MNKEEFGLLYQNLGKLLFVIYQIREQENIIDFKDDIITAIKKILLETPILEEHIKN